MPHLTSNYGLDFLAEDKELFEQFLNRIVFEGKKIKGYSSVPMYFLSIGDPEFWLYTEQREKNQFHLLELHTHCGGNCLWKMVSTGMDITSGNQPSTGRTLVLRRKDGSGCLPVNLITADVLPSFLEGDPINVQVVAQPVSIEYYADWDAYTKAQPEGESGGKTLFANGSLLALPLVTNHSIHKSEQTKEYDDDLVCFTATVNRLLYGLIESPEGTIKTFVRCFADTEYGPLEFDHSFDQVPEEMQDSIKVGAVISGVCVLSGDVAILEYENGPIFDAEHNLSLVRQALTNGEAERLRCALSEEAVYSSEISGKTCVGPDEIIQRINGVYNKSLFFQEYRSRLAIGKSKEDNQSTENPCILLSRECEREYESAVFVDTDENGMITGIRFANPREFDFVTEPPDD